MSAESSSATPAATAAGKGTSGGVPKSKGHQYQVTVTTMGYTVTWEDKSFKVGTGFFKKSGRRFIISGNGWAHLFQIAKGGGCVS